MMVDFLAPFKHATNIIQSDQAGLLDVYFKFQHLYEHVQRAPQKLKIGARIMKRAIKHHWLKHVHHRAVYMSAKFAMEDTSGSIVSTQTKLEAGDWFVNWAAKLWKHSCESSSSIEDISQLIQDQFDEFTSRAACSQPFGRRWIRLDCDPAQLLYHQRRNSSRSMSAKSGDITSISHLNSLSQLSHFSH